MGDIRVGTSGWQYDDWDGRFYPEDVAKKRWFDYYATVFPTVEINYTFYRLPRQSTVESWHDRAPNRFRFAAKGSRYITHNLKLNDPADAIGNVTGRLAGLKTFLAVVLWQLPPNLHKDVPRLDRFLSLLPGGAHHAVEFRHRSWLDDEVFATLDGHGAAHVWVSSADMPSDRTLTGRACYLRFHGIEDGYKHDYSRAELAPWAAAVREAAEEGLDAFVYFNNDHQAKAPRNARAFIELLGDDAYPWAYPWGEDS